MNHLGARAHDGRTAYHRACEHATLPSVAIGALRRNASVPTFTLFRRASCSGAVGAPSLRTAGFSGQTSGPIGGPLGEHTTGGPILSQKSGGPLLAQKSGDPLVAQKSGGPLVQKFGGPMTGHPNSAKRGDRRADERCARVLAHLLQHHRAFDGAGSAQRAAFNMQDAWGFTPLHLCASLNWKISLGVLLVPFPYSAYSCLIRFSKAAPIRIFCLFWLLQILSPCCNITASKLNSQFTTKVFYHKNYPHASNEQEKFSEKLISLF